MMHNAVALSVLSLVEPGNLARTSSLPPDFREEMNDPFGSWKKRSISQLRTYGLPPLMRNTDTLSLPQPSLDTSVDFRKKVPAHSNNIPQSSPRSSSARRNTISVLRAFHPVVFPHAPHHLTTKAGRVPWSIISKDLSSSRPPANIRLNMERASPTAN